MARPLKPLVRGGGYYPSRKWTPLVYNGGYTTMDGAGEPEPPVEWQTVTGVSPLSLANALAHSIKSLTQYGKCVQDGTPTPSLPVDIKCNNGALKWDSVNQRIYADGTPEVLTVCADGAETQTVTDIPMLLSVGDYKDEAEIISGIKTGRVGIKVYTGEETFSTTTIVNQCYTDAAPFGVISSLTNRRLVCTHFCSADSLPEQGSRQGVCIIGKNGVNCHVAFGATVDYPSIDAFKAFLAAQYAAGTPVIVVYPMAEETTEQTTPHSLNTTEGDNVVSVTSNVDPVNLTAVYASSEE